MRVFIDENGLQRYVRDVKGRFAKMGPVMSGRLEPMFKQAIVKQFQTEGEWGNTPWPELSDERTAQKLRSGTLWKGILRDSDRLFDAFATESSDEFHVEVNGRNFTYVIEVPYAYVHQRGIEGRTPARPIVPDPMPESFIAKLRNVIAGYIIEAELVEPEDQ